MREIIVATGKNAPNGYGVQKYSNDTSADDNNWNVLNGSAPNGVNATRWLRKTTPDVSKLSPLAAWLVEHVPRYCGGRMPSFNVADRVRVYNGQTVAEVNNWDERTRRVFAPEGDKPARIDDWLFDRIMFEESDEEYWNRVANEILAVGATMVEIGENKIDVSGFPRPRGCRLQSIEYAEDEAHAINNRLAEIDEWERKKMIQWADRPDNQGLCRCQAHAWRFKTKYVYGGIKHAN